MKLSIPRRPKIWAILAAIKGEDTKSYAKVSASLAGHQPRDPNLARTKRYLARQAKLKHLLEQYHMLPTNTYMDTLQAYFNDLRESRRSQRRRLCHASVPVPVW